MTDCQTRLYMKSRHTQASAYPRHYPPGIEDSMIVHVTQIASNNNPRQTPKQPISPTALLSLRRRRFTESSP
jgi:hypothetical protein